MSSFDDSLYLQPTPYNIIEDDTGLIRFFLLFLRFLVVSNYLMDDDEDSSSLSISSLKSWSSVSS